MVHNYGFTYAKILAILLTIMVLKNQKIIQCHTFHGHKTQWSGNKSSMEVYMEFLKILTNLIFGLTYMPRYLKC